MKIPSFARLVFNKYFFQKIFAILLLILVAYLLKWFVFLFLATFLFAYLFLSLWEFLHIKLNKLVVSKCLTKTTSNIFTFLFSINSIVLILYLIFIWLLVFAISDLIPKLISELSDLPKSMPFLSSQITDILTKLEEIKNFKQDIKWTLETLFTESNYEILLKFFSNLKAAWFFIIELTISLILSFVFIIDRDKIKSYLEEIKHWNFSFLYNEYAVIFGKVSTWFGLIFKAQSVISFVNTILTIIWLYFIALIHWETSFPYTFTLAILVFIFWMIPVLGMFLSSIPLIMIGFSFWWLPIVFEIIAMVIVIHMIEAYYLNPKIVSSYAEFPISMTFLILIISEQFFGFAWLLVWVPIFYILIDILKDFDVYISKVRKAYFWINSLKDETKKNIVKDIRLSRSGKKWV